MATVTFESIPKSALINVAQYVCQNDLPSFLEVNKDTADLRGFFVNSLTTSDFNADHPDHLGDYIHKWHGQITVLDLRTSDVTYDPLITLLENGNEDAREVLKNNVVFKGNLKVVSIFEEHGIVLDNTQALKLRWYKEDMQPNLLDKIAKVFPNVAIMALTCPDQPLHSEGPLWCMTKFQPSLRSLYINARVRVTGIQNLDNLHIASFSECVVNSKLPCNVTDVTFDCAFGYNVDDDNISVFHDCTKIKRVMFKSTCMTDEITPYVWHNVFGPSLEYFIDVDTGTMSCIYTRYLTKIKSFIVGGKLKHSYAIPLSKDLDRVHMKNVETLLFCDYLQLRRVPNLRLRSCRFGPMVVDKF